ncbi:nodulation protein NfeD, partial [Patescibacteria group bacterium]|nr:nodulation protein NfeD [Patescibacteria group bacterium]
AKEKKADCLIIQLDTPGGLDSSMREIVKLIMNSEIPVVVYVSPRGGRAASAGVFIALASHILAMAPGTNIGAAHPVALMGKMDKTMEEKVVNDAASYIKSIAEKRERNAEWAEKAVRESVSVTAREALNLDVIDVIAEDIDDLLKKLDKREIEFPEGLVTLQTKEAKIHFNQMSFKDSFLQRLADPNLAYILLMIGIWGIILEFFHPGAILPGMAGAICLILSFFSFQIIPFNLAGLLLIILAVILFILEVEVTSYGALTIGGIIALTLGSFMLIDPGAIYITISWSYIISGVAVTSALFIFIISYAMKAQIKRPVTGMEGMIGEIGVVRRDLNPTGKVLIHGEIWNAFIRSPEEVVKKGEKVEVVGIRGMELQVKKKGGEKWGG